MSQYEKSEEKNPKQKKKQNINQQATLFQGKQHLRSKYLLDKSQTTLPTIDHERSNKHSC